MAEVLLDEVLAPNQWDFHRDVTDHAVTHYWLAGGRGSTKSSAASIEVLLLLIRNPGVNVVALRKVGKTLRKSVYAQTKWAIASLGLDAKFKTTVSPMEITYRPTGQKIVFEGLDEPEKIKSLKFEHGYCGVVWFEEIDQFSGMEEVRNVLQSLMRGGDRFWCIYSFNPPRSRDNWVNRHLIEPPEGNRVYRTTYLDVPAEWLGERFIAEAEILAEVNEQAYRHEYLGEVVGSGGNVFDNLTLREIAADEIAGFDRVYNGVDWGYFPDPWVLVRCCYQAAQRRLYVFGERSGVRLGNEESAALVKAALSDASGKVIRETVTCDSAEPKSIANYRTLGIDARAAAKGPGSVDHGMKWLASRAEIVIDPARCPLAAKEFMSYEYERNREGEYVTGYPDRDNHTLDAARYALEAVIGHRTNV
jgi:PBSX family phage terminase large subunit